MCCRVHAELSLIAAEILIQSLNHGVIFFKEKYVSTNDVWRIAVDFDMSRYER